MGAQNTIMVKDYQHVRDEDYANAAITPGHFIYRLSTDKVAVHASAGQNIAPKMVAIEDELQGKTIDQAYAADDMVQYAVCSPGDWVNALVADGAAAIVKGDAVESAGDGTVQKHAADIHDSDTGGSIYTEQIIGIAREAIDVSGSSLADPSSFRVLIEIV
jgi:hypothetical protein